MPKIPKFKTDKEIAEFWDKHSLADYEDDLMPAAISFRKPKKEVITLRLDRPLVIKLKTMAKKVGIGYSSLARMWVMEKIEKELSHTSLPHR